MESNNQKIARRYLGELWSSGHLEILDELVAPGCEVRDPLFGGYLRPKELAAHIREMRRAFPDLALTIDAILAETGEQLAVAWSASGTHRGPLLGLLATGYRIRLSGLLLLRFERGKLITITAYWDPSDLRRQLELGSNAAPAPRAIRGSTPPMAADTTASKTPVAAIALRKVEVAPVAKPPAPGTRASRADESEVDAHWDN